MNEVFYVLPFFFCFAVSGKTKEVCSEFIDCETFVQQDSCPPGTFYREKVRVHNCCSGCVTLKGEYESCETPAECQPGLTCNSQKKCERDLLQACEYYKRYDQIWLKTKYWNPHCLPDGSYGPKQCKGEKMSGKCYCVSKEGSRIFGEKEWSAAENMTCACSRMVDTLRREKMDITLHCDNLGNFEPLQCDQKACWCANPSTGIPYTVMVPSEMMTSLPCYSTVAVGSQYYRQCESANFYRETAKSILENHGTTGIVFASQNCNYDGSYYRVQPFQEKTRCVYINNAPLTEAIKSDNANCNCAYDRYVAQLQQQNFFADCLPNGNYRSRQILGEKEYCVDEDGFHFSDDINDCS